MGILFIVALVLAWPTYGLSLVAWVALALIKAKRNDAKRQRREKVKVAIEPLFNGRFAAFFMALDIPICRGEEITPQEAHQCGRYIMNYIAHNPSETVLFIQGLQKWRTKGDPHLCDPVTAAEDERRFDAKGEIHMVCYRAVQAITTNNKLKCFDKIDLLAVLDKQTMLDINEIVGLLRR